MVLGTAFIPDITKSATVAYAHYLSFMLCFAALVLERKILKSDLGIYLDGDADLCRANSKVHYLETCISTCERILKSIDNRGFAIKNAFDIIKYYDIR